VYPDAIRFHQNACERGKTDATGNT